MKYRLLISVVLYHNTAEQVKKLLQSTDIGGIALKLVFVDNTPGGTDFMKEMLLPAYSEYRSLPQNVGYGRAHNQVINNPDFDSDYHLVLNPDVYFDPQVLNELTRYMDRHEKVGLLMPKVTWPNGEDQGLRKLLPAPFDLIFRRFLAGNLQKLATKRMEKYQLSHLDNSKPLDVPVLSGCFMFCRAKWLREIGGFDPRFFLYLEDVDLSRRMLQKGINRYWPGVHIVHEYQKGSYRGGKHLRLHIRSAFQYFNKHGWIFDTFRKKVNKKALNQQQ